MDDARHLLDGRQHAALYPLPIGRRPGHRHGYLDVHGLLAELLVVIQAHRRTGRADPALAEVLLPETLVVSFQNGIGPEDDLARHLSVERVARGVVNYAGGLDDESGQGNMIWFNLRGGFASVAEARNPLNAYVELPSLAAYAENVRNLIIQLLKMLSGTFQEGYAPLDYLREPPVLVYGLVLLLALIYTIRRGRSLPLALMAPTVLLMPYANRSYESLHDTRYIAFLLPLAYTAMGILLGDILQRSRRVTRWMVVLACLILVGTPLLSLGAYYRESMASGLSNEKLLHMALLLRDTRDRGGYVFVDKELKPLKLGGGGDPARAMDHLLALDGTPHTLADLGKMNWFLHNDPDGDFMLILAPKTHTWLAERYSLVPLELVPTVEEPDYGLYDFEGRH